MGLRAVAGVFSRYFIVRLFAPSFFILIGLSQSLTRGLLPSGYKGASNRARVLIVGGAALLLALVLVGLNYPSLRLFEGYPLRGHWYTNPLNAPMRAWQMLRLKRARSKTTSPKATDVERR